MKKVERAVSIVSQIEDMLFGTNPLPVSAFDLFAFSAPLLHRVFSKYVISGKYGVFRSWEEFCDWFILSYGAALVRTGRNRFYKQRFSVRWVCEKVSDIMADLEDKKNENQKKNRHAR